ncbi:hypothetical protein [Candidatus Palauibacter sp.]|uniref:hypothetical protein n=1 Tax=Candidatus Palauibacter sp. TaxID=3101350 RepID=UPI003AF23C57
MNHVRAELQRAEPFVKLFGLDVDTSMLTEGDLRIRVTGASRDDGERYVVEMLFDGYRAIPPFVEFVDPYTGEVGIRSAYPSCFHNHPCICAPYNRKTYGGHSEVHPEWQFGDWASNPGTEDIGGMLNHIFASINNHFGTYKAENDDRHR